MVSSIRINLVISVPNMYVIVLNVCHNIFHYETGENELNEFNILKRTCSRTNSPN